MRKVLRNQVGENGDVQSFFLIDDQFVDRWFRVVSCHPRRGDLYLKIYE